MGRVPFGDSSALYDQPSDHPGLDLAYLHLEQAAVMLADAQVHATLALAAAAGSGPADRARAT